MPEKHALTQLTNKRVQKITTSHKNMSRGKREKPVEEIYKAHGFCIYHQDRKFKNFNFPLQIKHQEII